MTTLIPKYDQGNSNAINRAINLKLAEVVSVLDFGADSTGVADSTTAIQNAINTGYQVHFPKGTYKTTSSLTLTGGQSIYGDGVLQTQISYTGSGSAITLTNAGNYITGMKVTTTSSATNGIYLNGSSSNSFTDVYVTGNPAKGWLLYSASLTAQSDNNNFINCGCNNAVVALTFQATSTGAVNDNSFYNGIWRTSASSGGTVCYLNGGGNGTGSNQFYGGDWSGYGGNSFVLDGTSSCTQNSFYGVFIDTGTLIGFVIGSNVSTTKIIGGTNQATTPTQQNNIASKTNGRDTILTSSQTYIPYIDQPSWSVPTLLNSWSATQFGSDATIGYYVDSCQIVRIKGTITGGVTTSTTNIFQLPAGYRPLGTERFVVDSNGQFASVSVAANGYVYINVCPSNTYLSLNFSFKSEQ